MDTGYDVAEALFKNEIRKFDALKKLVGDWVEARKHFAKVDTVHGPDKKDGGGWIPKEAWDRMAEAETALFNAYVSMMNS